MDIYTCEDTFQNRLKSIIVYRGFFQRKISKSLNISNSTLNGYVTGYRKPDFDTLKSLSTMLTCPVNYLLDTDIVKNEVFYNALADGCHEHTDIAKTLQIPLCVLIGFSNGQLVLQDKDISNIAELLKISVDCLLGISDTQTVDSQPLVIPPELEDVRIAFNSGSEGLSQKGLDDIADFIRHVKEREATSIERVALDT